jgi:hypothetical protein
MFFPVLRNQFWGQFLTNRVEPRMMILPVLLGGAGRALDFPASSQREQILSTARLRTLARCTVERGNCGVQIVFMTLRFLFTGEFLLWPMIKYRAESYQGRKIKFCRCTGPLRERAETPQGGLFVGKAQSLLSFCFSAGRARVAAPP